MSNGTPNLLDELDFVAVKKGSKLAKSALFIEWVVLPARDSPWAGEEALAAPHSIVACVVSLGMRMGKDAASSKHWEDASLLTYDLTIPMVNHHLAAMLDLGFFSQQYKDYMLLRTAYIDTMTKLKDTKVMEVPKVGLEVYHNYTSSDAESESDDGAGKKRPSVRGALSWLLPARAADLWMPTSPLPGEGVLRFWLLICDRHRNSSRGARRSIVSVGARLLREAASLVAPVAKASADDLLEALGRAVQELVMFPRQVYRLKILSVEEARLELKDSLAYARDAEEANRTIARRLLLARREYEHLVSIVEEMNLAEDRIAELERLSAVAAPGRHNQPLYLRLPDLERFVKARHALVTEARNKGKEGAALISLLLKDAEEHVESRSKRSSEDAESEEPLKGAGTGSITAQAWQEAFLEPRYREVRGWYDSLAVTNFELLDTAAGKRQLLHKCYKSECAIFQVAAAKPSAAKGRDELLSAFLLARGEESTYAGKAQAVRADGTVDDACIGWVWHESQVRLMGSGAVDEIAWLNPPHGAIALKNLTRASNLEAVPLPQVLTTVSCLKEIGRFGHATLVAFGMPEKSTTGYTWLTLFEKHRELLEWIGEQCSEAQPDLDARAETLLADAIRRIALAIQLYKSTDRPATAKLPHLLAFEEVYDNGVTAMKKDTEPMTTLQRAFPHMVAAAQPQSLPGVTLAPVANDSPVSRLKRGGTGDDDPKLQSTEAKPGSKAKNVTWSDDEHMRLGGDVFAVVQYSKDKLGLDKAAALEFCWPVLASRQIGTRKLAFCPCPTKAGHTSLNSKAHQAPQGFDRGELVKSYCEPAPSKSPKKKAKK